MLTVASWHPPFGPESVTDFACVANLRAQPRDVILVRITLLRDDAALEPEGLTEVVRDVRARHPGCPVVAWIPDAPLQGTIDAVRAATQAQVRAILGGNPPDPALLRTQLTHPLDLGSFVLRWASDAGYLPRGLEQEDVRKLLDAAPNVRTLERLALLRQVAARTWRSHLQQLGLPNPRAWLGLTHALHVAFFVQRHYTESLQTLSERLGMLTVAHMGQQFRRVFGLSPGQVRDLLGAEPLLHRWFQARTRR